MAVSHIPASLVEEYRSRPRGFVTRIQTGLVYYKEKLVAQYRVRPSGGYQIVPQTEDHQILYQIQIVVGDTLMGALNEFARNCRDNEEVWAYLSS